MILQDVASAINHLAQGELLGLPTETVYGLAADATNIAAVQKVYAIKNRPITHPLIVHIAELNDLYPLVKSLPKPLEAILSTVWPGPLTVVLTKSDRIDPVVTGGQNTVAIRLPSHPLARAVIRGLGKPVVAPSANPFGKVSPTTALHVAESFPDLWVLDGGRCEVGIESTLIDASSAPEKAFILRHGVLTAEDLNMACGVDYVQEDPIRNSKIRAPGVLKSHYCPNKPLFIFKNEAEKQAILAQFKNNASILELPDSPQAYAYQLYFQLRLADASSQTEAILIKAPPIGLQWQGIWERLNKASNLNA